MLKKILIVIVALIGVAVDGFSQDNNTILAQVQYKVLYTKDSQKIIDDICQLDISKNQSYFYSTGEIENIRRIQERFTKAQATGTTMRSTSADRLHNLCVFKIYKNYDAKKAFYIQNAGPQLIGFLVDTLKTSRWKISKEVTSINGLSCRKATMKKDSINIVAWFSADVPLKDGPSYFYGLPGLIVKASTDSGFDINLVSIKYNKDPKKVIQVPSYSVVTQSQMLRAMRNQNAAFRNGQMPNGDKATQVPGNN